MATLHHALGLLQDKAGDLDMALGRLVEGGGDDLGIDGAGHVRDLLRALVDEQHHQVGFGMVGGNGIGHVLHEHGLTSLGLGDDQRALTLANRGEEIDDTRAQIGGGAVATEHVFLVGEERREVLESTRSRTSEGTRPLILSMLVSGKYFSPSWGGRT